MRYITFLVIALLLGTSVLHADPVEGFWYGSGYQPEVRKKLEWLTINRSDGTFSVEFREYDNCRLKFVQTETGRWTASGDVIRKKLLTINGRQVPDTAYHNDTYKILDLNDRKMRLVHEKSGQEWTLERVTPDFTFPECKVS